MIRKFKSGWLDDRFISSAIDANGIEQSECSNYQFSESFCQLSKMSTRSLKVHEDPAAFLSVAGGSIAEINDRGENLLHRMRVHPGVDGFTSEIGEDALTKPPDRCR